MNRVAVSRALPKLRLLATSAGITTYLIFLFERSAG